MRELFLYCSKSIFTKCAVLIGFSISLIFNPFTLKSEVKNESKIIQSDTLKSSDILFTYPTPKELLEVIEKDQITFDKTLLNSVGNEKQYIETKSRNLNLGVYIVDLTYSAFFNKRTKIINYIEIISKLSDNLLISNETRLSIKDGLINNIEDLDSIYRLTSTYYRKIMQELYVNNNYNVMAIISTGSHIESIYLSLSSIPEFANANNLGKKIAEQKNALISLNNTSKLYGNDLYIKDIMVYQEQILNIYNQIEYIDKGKIILIRNSDGTIKFKSTEKALITEQQFLHLKNAITKIRNDITLN